MKKVIRTLIIEVTRRCNLKCEHCLRGDAENLDIDTDYISKILENVTSISNVVFTGGEPLLNIQAIKYFFKEIEEKKIDLGSFWLATNGTIYSEELVLLLIDQYSKVSNREYCGLAVSADPYHDSNKLIKIKYSAFSFYDTSKEKEEEFDLINMGNAYLNGIGSYQKKINSELIHEIDDGLIEIDEIYLNCKGNIIADCDISFDLQDEYTICSVYNLDKFLIGEFELCAEVECCV